MYAFLLVILVIDSVLLLAAVLLQAGQGGGLASLGGGAGTEMFMGGRQAVTLLTKITWWCAGIFLTLALTLAIMSSHTGAPRSVLQGNIPAPPPIQTTPLPLPVQGAQPSGAPAPAGPPPASPAPSQPTNP
jgi:protein translocase SecG subunit